MLPVKANALAEIEGNEVYVIVTDNIPGTQIHPLSHKVHLIDLGINTTIGIKNAHDWQTCLFICIRDVCIAKN